MKPKTIYWTALFILFYSCTYHKLNPNAVTHSPSYCDTINTSYAKIIQPILLTNCYPCHGSHSELVIQQNGLNLEDTAILRAYLKIDFRGDQLYGSKFYHCILHSQLTLPMPPNSMMDSCDIKKIKKWIDVGAPFL